MNGYLVLETGEIYQGRWHGGKPRAGEVVFNTAHSGYEEIATDPSYYSQIIVMTSPMQGNYGVEKAVWESRQMWIDGFVALQIQTSRREQTWVAQLTTAGIPVLSEIDTRDIVLRLRQMGTPWGALVAADNEVQARSMAMELIDSKKRIDGDWVWASSRRSVQKYNGAQPDGARIALLDYGCKENIIRELASRSKEVAVFPSRTTTKELREWAPDGIMLSNGPGDPAQVKQAVETVKEVLGWRPVFGICMGHQVLALALGAKTFKMKFGHRGSNHPVRDMLCNKVYVTSQNHGYTIDESTLPSSVSVTHVNLNDQTIEGIADDKLKCFSVQYHPESHPGPHEARMLFDVFISGMVR